MNDEKLRQLIASMEGEKWDDKVVKFAKLNGRSRSSVYRWLEKGAPPLILEIIEYRMTRPLQQPLSDPS